jgi:signal peptidase II
MRKRYLYFFLITISVIVLDQLSKLLIMNYVIMGKSISMVNDILYFTFLSNTGATWGMFKGNNAIFIILSVICLGVMLFYHKALPKPFYANALIVAGITGNLIDRILWGYVIDFIDLRWWPVFNVSDSAISIGIAIIIIYSIKTEIVARRRTS